MDRNGCEPSLDCSSSGALRFCPAVVVAVIVIEWDRDGLDEDVDAAAAVVDTRGGNTFEPLMMQ